MKIVFMGTPDFAVPSLNILVKNNYNVVAVITAPDKQSGRGLKLHQSAVKAYAMENNIPVLQPPKLKDPDFIQHLRSLEADLFIVVAFRMLPQMVWEMPPKGTFNLHASLLPNYRGAAPINYAIINGEKETGATTFFLSHEIDTGNIILQEKCTIADDESAGELHDRLMVMGANLVLKTVQLIEQNKASTTPQAQLETGQLKTAHKIFKNDCIINWSNTVEQINNLIRGLSPFPTAITHAKMQNDEQVLFKIQRASREVSNPSEAVGSIISDGKTYIKVAAKDGVIILEQLQMEGKKSMSAQEFLRGFDINKIKQFV